VRLAQGIFAQSCNARTEQYAHDLGQHRLHVATAADHQEQVLHRKRLTNQQHGHHRKDELIQITVVTSADQQHAEQVIECALLVERVRLARLKCVAGVREYVVVLGARGE
jgi:hypothetical protein